MGYHDEYTSRHRSKLRIRKMNKSFDLINKFSASYPFLKDRNLSHGLCFWACLVFAELAEEENIKINLVRWKVVGDRHFSEHWAVALNNDKVADFTRAQVDGRNTTIHKIDDYPPNYYSWRHYPADLFLEDFKKKAKKFEHTGLMPDDFLLSALVKIGKYDLDFYPAPPLIWWKKIGTACLITLYFFYAFWCQAYRF